MTDAGHKLKPASQLGYKVVAAALVLVLLAQIAPEATLTLNKTPSVPMGLYRGASADKAEYVNFCLTRDHRAYGFYALYCSPDAPRGKTLLKRIGARHEDGSLTVLGQGERPIDSTILGKITPAQQRHFWVPLWVQHTQGDTLG